MPDVLTSLNRCRDVSRHAQKFGLVKFCLNAQRLAELHDHDRSPGTQDGRGSLQTGKWNETNRSMERHSYDGKMLQCKNEIDTSSEETLPKDSEASVL